MNALIVNKNIDTGNFYKMALNIKNHEVVLANNGENCLKAFYDELKTTTKRPPFDVVLLDSQMSKQHAAEIADEISKIRPDQKIISSSNYLDEYLMDIASRLNNVVELIKRSNSAEKLVDKLNDKSIYDLLEKLNSEVNILKNTKLNPINSKNELVEISIEKALLKIGTAALQKTIDTLYNDYHCHLSDCYEHPEYLQSILHNLFGSAHTVIVESIRKDLEEFTYDKPIEKFLEIIAV